MDTEELPVVIAQTGPLNGYRWTLSGSITIGRDADCEIVIPDRHVSRYHARLSNKNKDVILEDLASKNGTFCNGNRITEPIYIHDGDLIQVALIQQFVFLSSDSTLPVALPVSHKPTRQGLVLESRSRRVWVNQQEVLPPLSVPQFNLLDMLYQQEGKVVSRNDLILCIWGEEEAIEISDQALDALVRRLRDRLSAIDPDHSYINTIRGHGLRFDNCG